MIWYWRETRWKTEEMMAGWCVGQHTKSGYQEIQGVKVGDWSNLSAVIREVKAPPVEPESNQVNKYGNNGNRQQIQLTKTKLLIQQSSKEKNIDIATESIMDTHYKLCDDTE